MENKEHDALVESIYKQVNSICDKLYDIVWEPQDLAEKIILILFLKKSELL